MKRSKHHGDKPATCTACITLAEQEKMPWHNGWGDYLASHYEQFVERHNKATKKEREAL